MGTAYLFLLTCAGLSWGSHHHHHHHHYFNFWWCQEWQREKHQSAHAPPSKLLSRQGWAGTREGGFCVEKQRPFYFIRHL